MPLEAKHMGKAYGAIKSALGRRACAEGWGVALFEYIAEHGVWPTYDQEQALIAHAQKMAAQRAKLPAKFRLRLDNRAARLERIAHGSE
jgi:hypothetical protein